VELALAPFAEKPREERFLPHVTIGRFQKFRRHKTEKLLSRATAFRDRAFGEWQVDAVQLMRSELSADGARHTIVATAKLGSRS
jgi:2'-5' RNA ligase